MPAERIQEIVDFATTESPYRSANKGWLSDDIYLQWSSTEEKSSQKLDQLAKVSVFWRPIIEIISIIFVVICIASTLAFMPLAFSSGRLQSSIGIFQSKPYESTIQENANLESKSIILESSLEVTPAEGKIVDAKLNIDSAPIEEKIVTPNSNSNSLKTSSEGIVQLEKKNEKTFPDDNPTPSTRNLRDSSPLSNRRAMKKVKTATDLFQPTRK